MAKAIITARHLMHARTHRKECGCHKSECRDPKCSKNWPGICPWWAMQLHRFNIGDFASPEWWRQQLNMDERDVTEPSVRESRVANVEQEAKGEAWQSRATS